MKPRLITVLFTTETEVRFRYEPHRWWHTALWVLMWICVPLAWMLLTGCGSAWAVDFNPDGTLKSIKLDGRVVPVVQEPAPLVQEPAPLVLNPSPVEVEPEPEVVAPVPATPFSRARDLLAQLEAAGRFREARALCQRLVQAYGRAVRTPWNFGSTAIAPLRRPRAIDDPLRNGAGAFDDLDRLLRSGDRMQPH